MVKLFFLLSLFVFFSQNVIAFEILTQTRIHNKILDSYYQEIIAPMYQSIGVKPEFKYITEKEINEKIKTNDFDAIGNKISESGLISNALEIPYSLYNDYNVHLYQLMESEPKKIHIAVGLIAGNYAHQKTVISNKALFSKTKSFTNYDDLVAALTKNEISGILLTDLEFEFYLKKYNHLLSPTHKNLKKFKISHFINIKHKSVNIDRVYDFQFLAHQI